MRIDLVDSCSVNSEKDESGHEQVEEIIPKRSSPARTPYFTVDRATQAYLNDMGKFPLLQKEEFVALLDRYQELGDEDALHELVVHNLRLSTIVAKKYGRQNNFTYLDILQICNQAMCEGNNAFSKYSPDKGPFVDYILYSLRNAVNREFKKSGGAVRIPEWLHVKIKEARNRTRELRDNLGREATLAELANSMGLGEEALAEYFKLYELNICSFDDEAQPSNGSGSITVGSRIVSDSERPDFQVRAREELERSFNQIRDLLVTIADTIPSIFAKSGRPAKEGPIALRRKYKPRGTGKNTRKNQLLIERNFNIVVEFFGLEDETLEVKSPIRVAEIVSKRFGIEIYRQIVENALNKIWENLPDKYAKFTKQWLVDELQKLELLIELTHADRQHLIYLLKRGNRLF